VILAPYAGSKSTDRLNSS